VILEPVARGGMGEVYRGKDTRLDRVVAIKVLPQHHFSHPQARERFEREARAISALSHPHICALYDIGSQDEIDYLVMKNLEGETLANRLKKGPLPLEHVLGYATEIAHALDTAHQRGVIHRDLKPGNVRLTKTGAKLLDFGVAKIRVAEAAASSSALATQTTPLTGEGAIVGTPHYMSPEQTRGEDLDARTDLFSFGVVLYEMATAQQPFQGNTSAVVFHAILSQTPISPVRLCGQMCRSSWNTSSTRRWRKTGSYGIRARRRSSGTCNDGSATRNRAARSR